MLSNGDYFSHEGLNQCEIIEKTIFAPPMRTANISSCSLCIVLRVVGFAILVTCHRFWESFEIEFGITRCELCEWIWSSIYAFPLLGQVLLDDANDGTLRHLFRVGWSAGGNSQNRRLKEFISATFGSHYIEAVNHSLYWYLDGEQNSSQADGSSSFRQTTLDMGCGPSVG